QCDSIRERLTGRQQSVPFSLYGRSQRGGTAGSTAVPSVLLTRKRTEVLLLPRPPHWSWPGLLLASGALAFTLLLNRRISGPYSGGERFTVLWVLSHRRWPTTPRGLYGITRVHRLDRSVGGRRKGPARRMG